MERLVIVAEERETQWGRALLARGTEIARQITAQNIASVIGESGLHLAEKKDRNAESEIVLWGRSEGQFLAAWTSLDPQEEIVNFALCQAKAGLVAEVFSTESARSLAEPLLQAPVFTNLGERRGRPVARMRGVPISAFGQCIGVLTWVGYGPDAALPSGEDHEVSKWALVFARFAELKILKLSLGMNSEL
jgi:hypothetical protein